MSQISPHHLQRGQLQTESWPTPTQSLLFLWASAEADKQNIRITSACANMQQLTTLEKLETATVLHHTEELHNSPLSLGTSFRHKFWF
jgi:hypothetical protein